MPYYYFDRCPEEKLPEIEELVLELGLESADCGTLPDRQWRGLPFGDNFDGFLLVGYHPHDEENPFFLQTAPKNTHRNPDTLEVIRGFVAICEPSNIYALSHIGEQSRMPYDMAEFE